MKALRFFLFVLMLTSTQLLANNLPPESVIQLMPNRTWLYTGEQANFDGSSSYDRDENGNSITNYYWYVRIGSGSYVLKASGSSATDYQICFELGGTAYATTANGCIATGSNTTATVRLKVYDDEGSYDYGYSTVTIKTPAKSRYFITDHLGNIRTTIDEDGEAMGADDYFPFGLIMPGRSNTTANANDLYKYTSHERDEEASMSQIYAGARSIDPVLGRWSNIDPLVHQMNPNDYIYHSVSPYNYALNNPVINYDPNGLWVVIIQGSFRGMYKMVGGSGTIGLALDDNMNLAVVRTGGVAVGAGMGAALSFEFASYGGLDTVNDLQGFGFNVGAVEMLGNASVSGEFNTTMDAFNRYNSSDERFQNVGTTFGLPGAGGEPFTQHIWNCLIHS